MGTGDHFPGGKAGWGRSLYPHGLMRGSAAPRLLGLRLESPQRHGYLSFFECCFLSGRGLCVDLITHPEESYRVWCVELSVIVKPW